MYIGSMCNVYIEACTHIQTHHENCDAACVANSNTETEGITQELHDKRNQERTKSIENTLHMKKELQVPKVSTIMVHSSSKSLCKAEEKEAEY